MVQSDRIVNKLLPLFCELPVFVTKISNSHYLKEKNTLCTFHKLCKKLLQPLGDAPHLKFSSINWFKWHLQMIIRQFMPLLIDTNFCYHNFEFTLVKMIKEHCFLKYNSCSRKLNHHLLPFSSIVVLL